MRRMDFLSLTVLYAKKTDEELLVLVSDLDRLTFEAQSALRNELERRKLRLEPAQEAIIAKDAVKKASPGLALGNTPPVVLAAGSFVGDVFRLYHTRLSLFLKLTAPAVLLGTVAILAARNEGIEILRHAKFTWQSPSMYLTLLEEWFVNTIGWAVSWTSFGFAFACICVAVRQVTRSNERSAKEVFREVAREMGPFLRITLLLFLIFLVLVYFTEAVVLRVILRILGRFPLQYPFVIFILSFALYTALALIMSRFALAIPAVVLDESRVGRSLFLSDELTEKKWAILAILLIKSILGGYIAGMSPFWLARWLLSGVHLPSWSSWVLTAASVAAVSYVEPIMFIGFALMYEKTNGVSTHPWEPLTQVAYSE